MGHSVLIKLSTVNGVLFNISNKILDFNSKAF